MMGKLKKLKFLKYSITILNTFETNLAKLSYILKTFKNICKV